MRDDVLQLRAFASDVTHLEVKRDGLVEGLIVPYNRPTDVLEEIRGELVAYREQFVAGVFARADPSRVGLTFTHSDLMPDRMGYGRSLRESEEGAVMEWKLYDYARDQATELLETTHNGLSVTFRTIRPQYGTERSGELVTRQLAHLSSVAATDNPAYADARVLALREDAAVAKAEQEAEQERARRQVEALSFLKARGRELSPVQLEFLEQHKALLPV